MPVVLNSHSQIHLVYQSNLHECHQSTQSIVVPLCHPGKYTGRQGFTECVTLKGPLSSKAYANITQTFP